MVDNPSPHPSDAVLCQYAENGLDRLASEQVSEHLRCCDHCVKRLDDLGRDDSDAGYCPTDPGDDQSCAATRAPRGAPTALGDSSSDSAPLGSPPPPPANHSLLEHPDYEIIRELGRGGMGVVYLAHNRLLGRTEVLKALDHNLIERSSMRDRFLREIRAVARLRHPNIVAAYHAFHSGDRLIFAMEYVEGLDLARLVKAKGPLPVDRACYFAHEAALALQHAHEEGMVHRDIKPGNLMLSHAKGRPIIKILDFGLAKANRELHALDHHEPSDGAFELPGEQLTLAGQLLGTPEFIAPEQIDNAPNADTRADIYSLGCTLYFLLSGGTPFPRTNVLAVMLAHRMMSATPINELRPDVPAELAAVVAKMMEKAPDNRFQTPDEVAKALAPFFKKLPETSAATLIGSAPAATSDQGLTATQSSSACSSFAATAADRASAAIKPDAIWDKLIEFKDSEDDAPAPLTSVSSSANRPIWLRPMVLVTGGIVGILLTVALIVPVVRKPRADRPVSVALGPTTDPSDDDEEPDSAVRPLSKQTPVKEFVANSEAPSPSESAPASLVPESTVASTAKPAATGTDSSAARSAKRKNVAPGSAARSARPFIKSQRWEWIHDASNLTFDRWVENVRARGYRPVFVNGHDLATQIRLKGQPDADGKVRIAAIAVREEPRLSFQVARDPAKSGFDHFQEFVARRYSLTSISTFTDGTLPYVLAVYTEGAPKSSYLNLGPAGFPGDRVAIWQSRGVRPFSISGRPAGDFWHVVLGTKGAQGVDWSLRVELRPFELKKVLADAKASGFRPDNLFVCPGTARGGFGVVLTNDRPGLLWEVHPDVSSEQLADDLSRMVERGFAPDQVVGYAVGGASYYLVCWTRNPVQYPVTGVPERWLERLDLAVEQWLVDHRIMRATMAIYHSGHLASSRGFGWADEKTREPLAPTATMSLADLNTPLAVAAVHSLIRKKKLGEDDRLADLLSAPQAGVSEKPPAKEPEPKSPLTLGQLIGRVGESAPLFDESEWKAVQPLVKASGEPAKKPGGTTDLPRLEVVLDRILEKATSKPANDAIVSELASTARLTCASPDELAAMNPGRPVPFLASAAESGRFFLKHHADGRPFSARLKPQPGFWAGRQNSALVVIERHDQFLVVMMLDVPAESPPDLADTLRSVLEPAVDALPHPPASPSKRKSAR
jgi:serine/threonine protein kinase